jgi:Mrp family chromosome partitioning ATPase
MERNAKAAPESARVRILQQPDTVLRDPHGITMTRSPMKLAPFDLEDRRLRLVESLDGERVRSIVDADGSRLAGQIRTLKLNACERLARGGAIAGRPVVVLVTSALPGDGKSFTSLNLALSFARERHFKVTLVDADVARRNISRLFAAEELTGLIDWLDNPQVVRPTLYSTAYSRLALLPAGAYRAEEPDSLTQGTWRDLISMFRDLGPDHVVIVDSAPVLATGDAQFLASACDLVLFVVRALTTPAGAVEEAIGRLGDPARIACVLNGSSRVEESYSDYYGAPPAKSQRGRR